MDFSTFYVIKNAWASGATHLKPETRLDKFALLKGDDLLTVRVFRHVSGSATYDLIGTGHAGLYLLSEKVFSVLEQNAFTGWANYTVEVYNRYGREVTGYSGLVVTGRCGVLLNEKSDRVWREPRVPDGKRYQAWMGLYFDPQAWDGSDVFSPDKTMHVIVNQAVKTALEEAGVTNIGIERLTEIERIKL